MTDHQNARPETTDLCLCVRCNRKPRMIMFFLCDDCRTREELAALAEHDAAPGKGYTRL